MNLILKEYLLEHSYQIIREYVLKAYVDDWDLYHLLRYGKSYGYYTYNRVNA